MPGDPPFEPYVAEPAASSPSTSHPLGGRLRSLVAVLILLILAAGAAWTVIAAGAAQDPALEAPASPGAAP